MREIPVQERTPHHFAARLLAIRPEAHPPFELDALAFDFMWSVYLDGDAGQAETYAGSPLAERFQPEVRKLLPEIRDLYEKVLGDLIDEKDVPFRALSIPNHVAYRLEGGRVRANYSEADAVRVSARATLLKAILQEPFPFARCVACNTIFYRGSDGRRIYCPDGCPRPFAQERADRPQMAVGAKRRTATGTGVDAASKKPRKGGKSAKTSPRRR